MELFEFGYWYQVMLLQVHKCDVYKQLQKVGLYGKIIARAEFAWIYKLVHPTHTRLRFSSEANLSTRRGLWELV